MQWLFYNDKAYSAEGRMRFSRDDSAHLQRQQPVGRTTKRAALASTHKHTRTSCLGQEVAGLQIEIEKVMLIQSTSILYNGSNRSSGSAAICKEGNSHTNILKYLSEAFADIHIDVRLRT